MSDIQRNTMDIREAIKFIRRMRGAKFMLHANVQLPVIGKEKYHYPMFTSVRISRQQAIALLNNWAGFSDRKIEDGKDGALVKISWTDSLVWIG